MDLSKAFLLFFRRCLFDLSCLLVVVCFVCGGVSLLLESVCVGLAKELVSISKHRLVRGYRRAWWLAHRLLSLIGCTRHCSK